MPSCKKRVYRTMCEQADGSRSGRYKKNRYNSVPIDAKKKASGTKKASKPIKNTKSKAKPVKMPVIDYEDDYDRHLDNLEMDRDLEKDHDLWLQKQYLRDQYAKRQASKRKKYTNTKKNHDDEAYAIISKSIDRVAKMDFDRVLDDAVNKERAKNSKYRIVVDSKGKARTELKPIVTYKVYFRRNPSDIDVRYVKKRARSLEDLRSKILSEGTLGKSYNKSVWIYTEDSKWVGRMRANNGKAEWTSNEEWTNVKNVDKFGLVI